jgi:hypothetical protein
VDLHLDLVFALLQAMEFDILAPSWAISNALAHLIFALAWEKYVVLYHI